MRTAVYRGAGRLAAEDWPTPSIGAGEVLLRLKGCKALKVYVTP